jgi:hypothetical protein
MQPLKHCRPALGILRAEVVVCGGEPLDVHPVILADCALVVARLRHEARVACIGGGEEHRALNKRQNVVRGVLPQPAQYEHVAI